MQEVIGDRNDPNWAPRSVPTLPVDLTIDQSLALKSASAMPNNNLSFSASECDSRIESTVRAQNANLMIVDTVSSARHYLAGIVKYALPFDVLIVQADSDEQAVERFEAKDPSMVIMDPLMPHINGVAVARRIWSSNPKARILFWMQSVSRSQIAQIVKEKPPEAIHGFILKSGYDQKLTFAIQSVFLHNNQYLDPEMNLTTDSESLTLTARELATLVDIALGLTDRAIASKNKISVRGVQNRIQRIFQKMLGKKELLSRNLFGSAMLNHRARVLYEALSRGIIDLSQLESADLKFFDWIDSSSK